MEQVASFLGALLQILLLRGPLSLLLLENI